MYTALEKETIDNDSRSTHTNWLQSVRNKAEEHYWEKKIKLKKECEEVVIDTREESVQRLCSIKPYS